LDRDFREEKDSMHIKRLGLELVLGFGLFLSLWWLLAGGGYDLGVDEVPIKVHLPFVLRD
jgi:hypothetical protein